MEMTTSDKNDSDLLESERVQLEIEEMLLTGDARTAAEAENRFLDAHLDDIAQLALALTDAEFGRHEAVKLLMSHGSRPWEDSVR